MKKFFAFLLAATMVMTMFTACGQEETKAPSTEAQTESKTEAPSQTETEPETSTEAAKKTFTVGFDAEYPPYGYMDDNGQYVGFDLDLAAALCEIEGWELVKTPIDWDTKDITLNAGEIDCIWNGFTRDGREDDYEWSNAYIDNSQVFVVAKDSGITDFAGLAGKVVGVQAGSAALTLLEDEECQKALADTFGALNQFADYNTAFTELLAGALDALAIDIGVANYQITTRGEGFTILEEKLNKEKYAVGAKKGNAELVAIINKDLKTLYENGTVKTLAEKYGIDESQLIAQ